MARWVKHFGLALCSALTIAGSASPAEPTIPAGAPPGGNGEGIDTHLFRPAFDSKGFFYTNGADILGHRAASLFEVDVRVDEIECRSCHSGIPSITL